MNVTLFAFSILLTLALPLACAFLSPFAQSRSSATSTTSISYIAIIVKDIPKLDLENAENYQLYQALFQLFTTTVKAELLLALLPLEKQT